MHSLSQSNKLLALALLISIVGCQRPVQQEPISTVAAPAAAVVTAEVALVNDLVDLGKVRMGELKKFEAVIRNNTAKPLKFQGFKTSCSCTNLTVTEKELPPGGEVRIAGQYRGQGGYGMFNRTIFIHWGDIAPAALRLTGEHHRDLVFEPDHLVLSPQASSRQADEQNVTIHNRGNKAITINWGNLPAGLSTSWQKQIIPAQGSITLTVKADPILMVKNQFQLEATTSHLQEERLNLLVHIEPRESLHVHPPAFHWGLLSQKDWQAKVPLKVKLWGPVLDACELSKIVCPDYLESVIVAADTSRREDNTRLRERVFHFTAKSEHVPANLNGSIVFHLMVKGQAQPVLLTIPVTGLLRDSQVARR